MIGHAKSLLIDLEETMVSLKLLHSLLDIDLKIPLTSIDVVAEVEPLLSEMKITGNAPGTLSKHDAGVLYRNVA